MFTNKDLHNLIDEIAKGNRFGELEQVIECEDIDVLNYLFFKANEIKTKFFGNEVYIRAIIEFSNHCSRACAYCGINCNMKVSRYRMTPNEIITTAKQAYSAGYKTIILQSGEDNYYTVDVMGNIISTIVQSNPDMALTLSIGQRSFEDYEYFYSLGAKRYLIKHETSSDKLYEFLHPNQTLNERISCAKKLYDLGYELGGGFMVGLPGQTSETLKNDILLLKELNVSMAGIGPFIHHPATPLGNSNDGSALLTLKVLALTRLVLPQIHLPSTTALNVKGGLDNALLSGANVIMQKVTPYAYRELYDIYPGRDSEDISFSEQLTTLKQNLAQINLCGI